MKPSLSLLLILLVSLTYGQDPTPTLDNDRSKHTIGSNYSIGLLMRNGKFVHIRPLDTVGARFEQDFAPVIQEVGLGYSYRLKSFLEIGGEVNYVFKERKDGIGRGFQSQGDGQIRWSTKADMWSYQMFQLNLFADLDLLWKLPDDKLYLRIGLSNSYLKREDRYEEKVAMNNDPLEPYNVTHYKRYDFLLIPYLNLGWTDFVNKHLGYGLAVQVFTRFNFSPYRLKVIQDMREGESFPEEDYRYGKGDNRYTQDHIPHGLVSLRASLFYRL